MCCSHTVFLFAFLYRGFGRPRASAPNVPSTKPLCASKKRCHTIIACLAPDKLLPNWRDCTCASVCVCAGRRCALAFNLVVRNVQFPGLNPESERAIRRKCSSVSLVGVIVCALKRQTASGLCERRFLSTYPFCRLAKLPHRHTFAVNSEATLRSGFHMAFGGRPTSSRTLAVCVHLQKSFLV